jgi:YD repeat-containing protein
MKLKPCPLPLRVLSWLLVVVLTGQSTIPIGSFAWAASVPESGSAAGVAPVRTDGSARLGVHKVKVKRLAAAPGPVSPAPRFSADPTQAEIFRAHVFEHPLVPVGIIAAGENKILADVLDRYVRRANPDDHSLLLDFLTQHPNSAWKPALLLNLGIILRQSGYFSRAVAAWQQAWHLTKNERNLKARALADTILGELVQLHAWMGRTEQLSPLLTEIAKREILGGAKEIIFSARQARWAADNSPEDAYKCGPLALRQILSLTQTNADVHRLFYARSTKQGFSLHRLKQLADEAGLNYQMARRKPGSPIPANSVIHWKFDHYGVITEDKDGKYLVRDTAFAQLYGPQIAISSEALEEEADGYFLVPKGRLPGGWTPVMAEEAQKVFGRGPVPAPNRDATTRDDYKTCQNSPSHSMAVASAHLCVVSLNIVDTPLWYTPARGPAVEFTATYIQRDPYTSSYPDYSNLGVCWTFDWLSYISDNGATGDRAVVTRYVEGGGKDTYSGYNSTSGFYQTDRRGNLLEYKSNDTYELNMPDGSKRIYAQPCTVNWGPRRMFLTSIQDAAGNAVTITYDTADPGKILSVNDALGQTTTLNYFTDPGLDNDYRIASVEDPFGRTASFEYDTLGRLKKITDMGGLSSAFSYAGDNGSFICQMTTPYGTSTFTSSESEAELTFSRELILTDPNGNSEKVRFAENMQLPSDQHPSYNGQTVWPSYLDHYRNTFYWDKKGMALGGNDVTNATIYHWLHDTDDGAWLASEILESLKPPLASRICFLYPGQSDSMFSAGITLKKPSVIARVVEEGGSPVNQAYTIVYNSLGHPASIADPVGRHTAFDYYGNNVDLYRVRQTNSSLNAVLAEFGAYDARHRPSTYIDAARQTYNLVWNSHGQITQTTNPKSQVTRYHYFAPDDPHCDQLQNIEQDWHDGAQLTTKTTAFDYDDYGRL